MRADTDTLPVSRPSTEERLPALACVSIWFAVAGGFWTALLSILLN